MKRLLIALCLCMCLFPLVSASDWYDGENITPAESVNESCQQYATDNGLNPDFWFRRTVAEGGGTLMYRQYSYSGFTDHDISSGAQPSTIPGHIIDYTAKPLPAPNDKVGYHVYCCLNTSTNCASKIVYNWTWSNTTRVRDADFTATPTSGPASLYVLFNDASTGFMSIGNAYNWSITPTTGVTGYTGSVRNHSASFATPGNYTVTYGVSDLYGSDIETKTNYIWVQDYAADYITTGFAAMDNPRWVQLAGAAINLLDVENNSWKNTSSSSTGYEEITTLNNHTISAYASLAGYSDAQLLSKPAWNGGVYQILMYPTGYANVSAGSVTLYVNVWEAPVSARLSGATVNVAYDLGGSQHSDYRITDSSGVVQFVVPNQTTIYIYAEKAGFTRGGTTVASGNGNGGNASVYTDVTLIREYVTTVPTPTTLPGGGTPTATPATVDPYPCDADHPENCQRKQTDMANDLMGVAPDLMWLFVIATILGVVKMMGK